MIELQVWQLVILLWLYPGIVAAYFFHRLCSDRVPDASHQERLMLVFMLAAIVFTWPWLAVSTKFWGDNE